MLIFTKQQQEPPVILTLLLLSAPRCMVSQVLWDASPRLRCKEGTAMSWQASPYHLSNNTRHTDTADFQKD